MDLENVALTMIIFIIAIDLMLSASFTYSTELRESIALSNADINGLIITEENISDDLNIMEVTSKLENGTTLEQVATSVPLARQLTIFGAWMINAFSLFGKMLFNVFFAWALILNWIFQTVGFGPFALVITIPIAFIEVYAIYMTAMRIYSVIVGGGI